MIEFPDFDLEEFYILAKRINDFIHNPDFEKWSQIITESVACNTQIEKFDKCLDEMKSIELKEVIKNNFTDFDGMHGEVNKCELF